MSKIFQKNSMRGTRYSAFDLSHERKLSMRMGKLVPTYVQEVLPGDHFSVRSEIMIRMAPMLAPVMHRVNVYMHYFFVPNRIVWNQWEDFITGGKNGTSNPTMPILVFTANEAGTLADHMGVPVMNSPGDPVPFAVSQLPFRAYQAIYNEYYRDQNLQDEVDLENQSALLTMRTRCWEKDYFTSALPWPQRGPAVDIPVEFNYSEASYAYHGGGAAPVSESSALGTNQSGMVLDTDVPGAGGVQIQNLDEEAVGVSINDLRRSARLQEWLERQARGGARYIETVLSHFGVRSSDSRMQRPEYLGGGRQPVVISEVLNTTQIPPEGGGAPVGEMYGHGISVGADNKFKRKFEEHGYVIGIMSVLPRTAYSQGLHRHFTRFDKLDYYWPEFANLGEQEVLNQEIYLTNTDDENQDVFGYQQRYAEYKYSPSTVHGDFREDLEFWHMARKFDTRPALNSAFVTSDPTDRIFAVEEGDHLWVQMYHDVRARRPMPYFSNPQL